MFGVLLGASPPAQADGLNGIDLYSVRAPAQIVVRSNSCLTVPVTAYFTTGIASGDPSYRDFQLSADMETWVGSHNVDSVSFFDWDERTGQPTVGLASSYYWCPNLDGPGTFHLGPTHVDVDVYDYDYNLVNSAHYLDSTTASFTARQASAASLAIRKVKGQPAKRRFVIGVRGYSISWSQWAGWDDKRVSLQRRHGADWRTVKVLTTDKHGHIKYVRKAKRGQSFRVVVDGTSRTWGTTSPVRTAR